MVAGTYGQSRNDDCPGEFVIEIARWDTVSGRTEEFTWEDMDAWAWDDTE